MNGLSIIIPVLRERERQNLKKLISKTHNSVKKIKIFDLNLFYKVHIFK